MPGKSGKTAPTSRRGTREHLLDIAGQVFAKRGYGSATGKEICQLAGVNAAAINYHFGGTEELYRQVLHEVVGRLVSVEELSASVSRTSHPREKLRAIIGFFIAALTGPLAASWHIRVLAREIVSPPFPNLLEKEVGQRVTIIKNVIAEILGVSPADPAIPLAYISVMAPCLMLLIGDRGRFERLFPALRFDANARETIINQLVQTSHGALTQLARTRATARPRS